MNKLKTEKILVIPTKNIPHLDKDFQKIDKSELKKLEDLGEYKTRYLMEEDESYDQLIPYIAIIQKNKLLTYLRSPKGGEVKLYNNYSVAVGGHVDMPDNILEAAIREIEEELGIKVVEKDLEIVGLINPDLTEVDKYHLGVAMILEVDENFDLEKGEMDILIDRNFDGEEKLKEKINSMENWSKVFLENYLFDYLKNK